ncbi:MAG TPA: PQQ-binding-like beta-propeller repeat protein [Acidimicrobiia bacterium]
MKRWVALILGASLLAAACQSGSSGDATSRTSARDARATVPTAPAGAPPEVAKAQRDWPLPGHDYSNSRATTTSRITKANVGSLKVAWRAQPQGLGSLTTSPLVLGDTVYLEDGAGAVFALDRATGDVRWKSKSTGFNIGPFGVAVGAGRVYAVRGSDGVVALDERTGEQVWERTLSPDKTTGIDIQPQVFGGQVFVSTVPISVGGIYIGGDHGVVYALDARTGKVHWTFDTVDSADQWGNPAVNSGGGAWYPLAIDAKRGVTYAGIANPAPFPGTPEFPNGSSRPGPNLYTDSIVALDLATGKLRWFQQVTQHDIFDRDQVHAMVAHLADGTDVVVSAGKSGVVLGIEPDTGKVLWRTPVGHHENDTLTTLAGPTEVAPGTYGGVLTPPANIDGTVYLPVVNAPVTLKPNATAYFGADVSTGNGEIDAVDARTGHVQWTRTLPGNPLGGTTVVNDLVLTALVDGTMVALDRRNGHVVWKYQAGGSINGWMSVAGDTIVVPVGGTKPPSVLALSLPGSG